VSALTRANSQCVISTPPQCVTTHLPPIYKSRLDCGGNHAFRAIYATIDGNIGKIDVQRASTTRAVVSVCRFQWRPGYPYQLVKICIQEH
jgi:hypothetical protein